VTGYFVVPFELTRNEQELLPSKLRVAPLIREEASEIRNDATNLYSAFSINIPKAIR